MKKKYKCYVCQKEINEEEALVFKGHTVHGGECIKKLCDEDNAVRKLEQENKHLNLQLDQALKDYEELLIKIDKAIEYIKENSYIVQDKEINGIPLMSKRLDKCDDLLEILGDKENE